MVYIIQEPRKRDAYDIRPALDFGQPQHIFKAGDQPGLDPITAQLRVRTMLCDFKPSHDYILWAGGDPYGLALVSAMLIQRFGSYNFLRWDRRADKQGGYYTVVPLTAERSNHTWRQR